MKRRAVSKMREGDYCVLPGTRRSIEYMRAWPHRVFYAIRARCTRLLLDLCVFTSGLSIAGIGGVARRLCPASAKRTCFSLLVARCPLSVLSEHAAAGINIYAHTDLETLNLTRRHRCFSPTRARWVDPFRRAVICHLNHSERKRRTRLKVSSTDHRDAVTQSLHWPMTLITLTRDTRNLYL